MKMPISLKWNRYTGRMTCLSLLLFFITACGNGEEDNPVEAIKPKLLSSVPADNGSDLAWGEQKILLTYDQNVPAWHHFERTTDNHHECIFERSYYPCHP